MDGLSFRDELVSLMPVIRRFAWKLTNNKERAEDLTQDVMCRALECEQQYMPGSNMKGWLCTICIHRYFSDRRKKAFKTTGQLTDDHLRYAKTADDPHLALEVKELMAAMLFLPPQMQEAVLLAAEGLEYEEMAAETGCEVGTVKSRVSRGRTMLATLYS